MKSVLVVLTLMLVSVFSYAQDIDSDEIIKKMHKSISKTQSSVKALMPDLQKTGKLFVVSADEILQTHLQDKSLFKVQVVATGYKRSKKIITKLSVIVETKDEDKLLDIDYTLKSFQDLQAVKSNGATIYNITITPKKMEAIKKDVESLVQFLNKNTF